MPDKLSVSANIDRGYSVFQMRVIVPDASNIVLPDEVDKTFNVTRNYNFSFPFAKSLKFDYTAMNDSRVLEPEGVPITTQTQKDSLKTYFFDHQVNTDFKQTENLSYEIPINKIPMFDFVSASARYTCNYEWMHAPFAETSIGGTIQNSNTKQINGQLNMVMLYNKVPFLKKYLAENNKQLNQMNHPPPGKGGLMNKNLKSQLTQKQKDSIKNAGDTTKTPAYYSAYWLIHLLTSVKSVSFTYSQSNGLVLPGFKDSTKFFGMDPSNGWIPGPTFVFGGGQNLTTIQLNNGKSYQVPVFIAQAIRNNWLDTSSAIYTPFTTISTQTMSLKAALEPIPDLKFDITASRTQTMTSSEYLHDSVPKNTSINDYVINTYTQGGSFTMSYFMLPTAFEGNSAANTNLFRTFLADRIIISRRLATAPNSQSSGKITSYSDTTGYDGYSVVSQNVLIPAFIAAYSGQNPWKVPLTAFPAIPFPNWTISYSGLTKLIPWLKANTQSVTVSSAYTSSYSIGSFNSNLLYNFEPGGIWVRNAGGDFIPEDLIPTVALTDQFSPLIKIGVTLKSNIMTNLEVRINRQLALNMSDLTIDEVHSQEYVAGLGYKIKNVVFPIKISNKPLKNDVVIKVDFSLLNNLTIVRNTENLSNQVTGGTSILSIKPQAEYNINQRVTIRLFFDKIINTPEISSSYPTSTMDGGIAIRFTLS